MKAVDYRKVERIFHLVVDQSSEQRQQLLEQHCGSDLGLRTEVERLLSVTDNEISHFMRVDAMNMASFINRPPDRIGQYRINKLIASGGMGAVYEAVQEHPRRKVALKILNGIASRSAVVRFEYESQVLARLRHAGIAQIYESGMHREGLAVIPFFAMEYVRDAERITKHAAARSLSTDDRLRLFTQVCDAVHHGHQKGIIHRDLKPANILVDSQGCVKVIDFGIARVTDSDFVITRAQTVEGQLVGTLQYMSPEQVMGDPDEVDVRSDVYALGVVLYEILGAAPPHDMTKKSVPEAARMIREESPARLSSLNSEFRGDIETIVDKAMQKEKERRYESAAEFADDIRRFLRSEPIIARHAGRAYRLRKFVGRHRGMSIGFSVAILALIAGLLGTITYALRERDQADRARFRASQAQAVTDFLRGMLASADPSIARGRDLTVRHALDDAAHRLNLGELKSQPEVEASLQYTIGETYVNLGHYAEAMPYLEAACATRRRIHGDDAADTIDALAMLAMAYSGLGQFDEAIRRDNDVLRMRRALLGDHHPKVASVLENLSWTTNQLGAPDKSIALCRKALAIRRMFADSDPLSLARCLSSLGALYTETAKYDEAESQLREALAIRRESLDADHPELAYCLNNLGSLLQSRGELAGAESLLTEALAIRERVYERDHPDLLLSMNNLATLYASTGRRSDAIPLMRQIVEIQRATLGGDHPDLGRSLLSLTFVLTEEGELEEAGRTGNEGLNVVRRAFGERHPNVVVGLNNLGAQYIKLGQIERAEPLLRDAISIASESLGDTHPATSHLRDTLGLALVELERYDEALSILEIAMVNRVQKLGPDNKKVGLTWSKLAAAHLGLGNYPAALEAARKAVRILGEDKALVLERAGAVLKMSESQIRLGDATRQCISNIESALQLLNQARAHAWLIADANRVKGLWLLAVGQTGDAVVVLSDALHTLNCGSERNEFTCEAVERRIGEALRETEH